MRSNWFCLRLLGLLAILAASSVPLRAQYGYSIIEASGGYVWGESVTDLDYYDDFWYPEEAYVGATLEGPSGYLASDEAYDYGEASVSLEAVASQTGEYGIYGDHYILFIDEEDFYPYWEYVGSSEDFTFVTAPGEGPPILWGISPQGGTSGQDGYIQIYGQNLAGGCQCGSVSFGEIVYESEGQINVYYPAGESPGTYSIVVSTPSGPSGAAQFTISTQDPTPVIYSISPGSLPAGATTTITVSGTGFGTSPNLNISGSGISYSVTGAADTVIYAQVSVASNAPYEPAMVTVTSNGYWGNGFIGTNSPTSSPYQLPISGSDPTPVITGISPAPPWQAGTSFAVTVSGSGFGSSPSFSVSGALISFTSYGGGDSFVSGYVSIDPSAPTETATITVASNGYYGFGFQQQGGQGNQAAAPVPVEGNPAPTPRIQRNGGDITGMQTNVMVGELISLNGVNAGGAGANPNWGLAGSYIGGFNPSVNGPGLTANVTTNQQNVMFYFVAPGNVNITYSLTGANGAVTTVSTTFVIQKPSPGVGASGEGPEFIDADRTCGSLTIHYGGCPGYTAGITFQVVPDARFGGSYEWVQVVVNADITADGTSLTHCVGGIDTQYPYSTANAASDSPNQGVNTARMGYVINENFNMFLLYNPYPGSGVYVPIAVIPWGWSVNASSSDGWLSVTIGSPSAYYQVGQAGNFPNWSGRCGG